MTISIPKTQRAAVVAKLGHPVEIRSDWPVVQPEDLSSGQVLIKMEVSGICHSDLHIKNGEWPSKPAPFIGGHEGVGTIVAFGKGTAETDKVKMGSRVGIKWVLGSCGRCEYCRTGRDSGCEDIIRSGQTADGTFSEYMVAYANHVVPIPEEISSDEAVPIMCAGLTVYAALKKGNLGVGEWVVIPGAGGGLGHLAIQYAVAMGLRVIAIDTGAEKKEACQSLGAEKWIDFAQTEDLVREVIAAAGAPGPHAALIVTPSINAYDQAVLYLRKYSTIIGVGIPTPPLTFKVPMIAILGKAIKIQPSVLGNLQEAIEALELVARKKVHAQTLPRKLDDITSTYEDMVAGKLVGRAVIHF